MDCQTLHTDWELITGARGAGANLPVSLPCSKATAGAVLARRPSGIALMLS